MPDVITPEERAEWRKDALPWISEPEILECTRILRLLNALEAAESALVLKGTTPCPYCDFSSGQRGMDRCAKCDGTGRVSAVSRLVEERDCLQRQLAVERIRAEKAEAAALILADKLRSVTDTVPGACSACGLCRDGNLAASCGAGQYCNQVMYAWAMEQVDNNGDAAS